MVKREDTVAESGLASADSRFSEGNGSPTRVRAKSSIADRRSRVITTSFVTER